jgi:hypothetical protein
VLGSRLMPTALFQSDSGRAEVFNALVNMLPHANPYIVVGTPFGQLHVPGRCGTA